MSIADNIFKIKEEMERAAKEAGRDPGDVMLLPVSKTVEPARMKEALAAGCTVFGENYVQELCGKYEEMHEAGASFHFIGHLQTNKVKMVIDKVEMIQSVDSLRLLREIDKQADKHQKVMDVLLEVNIGKEETKTGMALSELPAVLAELPNFSHVRLCGLMTIPPRCSPEELSRCFEQMRELYIDIREKKLDNSNICILSMGMSGDFSEAIAHGATAVRVGTAIFGARDYQNK